MKTVTRQVQACSDKELTPDDLDRIPFPLEAGYRIVSRPAKGAVVIAPRKVGVLYTDDDFKKLAAYGKPFGFTVMRHGEKGGFAYVIGPLARPYDWMEAFLSDGGVAEAARKQEEAEAKRKKEAQKEEEYRNLPSSKWIDENLGTEFANLHNRLMLARVLDGVDTKFRGLAGNSWLEPFKRLGYSQDQYGTTVADVIAFLKRKYSEQTKPKQEKISMTSEEAARYLKDFVYSLDQLGGVTGRVQVALSSPLGKSGRDKLLMEAFGLTREQAHDINNRLDASQPRRLRNVDMQEAFDMFPGLRKIVDDAVQAEKVREERRNSKNPAGQAQAAEQRTPVDATPSAGVQLGFSVFNHAPIKVNNMTDKTQASEAKKAEREAVVAAKKAEREAAKAARAAEREAARQAKKAEREAARQAKMAERAAKMAERAAKMAELGEQPKMLALRSAKGRYVKAKNGSLRSDDNIAQAFDGLEPGRTIAICMNLLGLDANPYVRLNIGQQSMNLRNKLRTAVKRGIISIDAVRAAAQS